MGDSIRPEDFLANENPGGKRLKFDDYWMTEVDDVAAAVEHAARQYLQDGVLEFELRLNPYKKFLGEQHADRLEAIQDVIKAISAVALKLENEQQNQVAGVKPSIKFMFSLNREKYGEEVINIIYRLIELKGRLPAEDSERMAAIDMSGMEMVGWLCEEDGRPTKKAEALFLALRKAKDAGFETGGHFGHGSSVDSRFAMSVDRPAKSIQRAEWRIEDLKRYIADCM